MGYINTASSENLQAALSLAKQGLAIFPAGPNKRPLVKGWQDVATADPNQIERWWTKWPDAMPAMPTGRKNGIAVMDVDLKDGKDGAAALLAAGHDPDLLSSVQCETPTGGRHIFMRWTDGMGNSNTGLPAGVDVRGEGGFIIAPGAVNGKGAYRLFRGSLGDVLPDWPEELRPRRAAAEAGEAQPSGRTFHIFAEALAAIHNDSAFDDRDAWLRIGMAIHAETGGSLEGFDLFDDWSAQHQSYDAAKTDAAWRSFTSDRKGGVSGYTIFAEARRRGWRDVVLEKELIDSCWSDEELAEIERKGMADSRNEPDWKFNLEADPEAWNLVFPPKSTLTFLSPGDCADLPSRAYVIKGLLAERDVAAIVGAPGAGKSLIAPHLGYAVARGVEVFGRRTRQGGVLYVATEDTHGMRARVKALRERHGDTEAFHVVEGVSDLLSKSSTDRKALRVAVEDRRPSLIVIDTLAFAFPGLEENDAKSMGAVVSVAKSLTKWGAAVILIHHDTKSGDQGLPRGHSILNGALDMSLHLKRDGSVVRGRPTKNRNGSADQELAFEIGVREMGKDTDGDPITVAICDEADASDLQRSGKPLPPTARAALEILEGLLRGRQSVQRDQWRAACIASDAVSAAESRKSRGDVFRKAVTELARRGLFISEGDQGERVRLTDTPEMLLGDDDVE